jgi:hypothetical protein
VNAPGPVLAVLVLLSALLSDLFVAPVLASRTRRAIAAGLTGSLWPSMLIHVLLDLRPLFVRTSARVGRDTDS